MNDNLSIKELMKKISGIYQQELQIYRRILKLTKEQKKAIGEREWQELNQLIDNKQKLINRIEELEKQLQPYKMSCINQLNLGRDFIPELLQLSQIPFVDKVKSVVKALYETMHKIKELDEVNEKKIIEEKNKIKKEMGKVKQGLSVTNSYSGSHDNYEGKFIDQTE